MSREKHGLIRGPLNLLPGLYLSVMDNASYYFFTGGGTVLTAIEQGSPYGLKPVQALIESKKK